MPGSDEADEVSSPVTTGPGGRGRVVGYATLSIPSSGQGTSGDGSASPLYDALGDTLLVTGGVVGAAAASIASTPVFGVLAIVAGLLSKGVFSLLSKGLGPEASKAGRAGSRWASPVELTGNVVLALAPLVGGAAYLWHEGFLWLFLYLLIGALVVRAVTGIVGDRLTRGSASANARSVEDYLLLAAAISTLLLYLWGGTSHDLVAFGAVAPALVKALPSLSSSGGGSDKGANQLHLKVSVEVKP